ncbi:MAG: hypothetical protein LBV16_09485, partial [Elusimicrobiota bacterium]|nr:hypothetical protein [Elusimicrobiota bacterium]
QFEKGITRDSNGFKVEKIVVAGKDFDDLEYQERIQKESKKLNQILVILAVGNAAHGVIVPEKAFLVESTIYRGGRAITIEGVNNNMTLTEGVMAKKKDKSPRISTIMRGDRKEGVSKQIGSEKNIRNTDAYIIYK